MKSRHNFVYTVCLALAALIVTPIASALDSDSEQPIKIQANSASLDDTKGITIYRGNVIIQQGSIEITGDQVTLTRDDQGTDKMLITGIPAHFKQQIEGSESYTEAFGNSITYTSSTEVLVAKTNAKIINDRDTFTGETIRYDIKNKLVNASGGTNKNGDQPGRVEMIIQPRSGANNKTP